jgi:hypothetical protein
VLLLDSTLEICDHNVNEMSIYLGMGHLSRYVDRIYLLNGSDWNMNDINGISSDDF